MAAFLSRVPPEAQLERDRLLGFISELILLINKLHSAFCCKPLCPGGGGAGGKGLKLHLVVIGETKW